MLIYNFQKEFIGIDEADLEVFGFANLSELKAEASDFADMFVRTPGYIHNFKHVHWIDFITCADSSEESKVIIEVNGKTYKASVAIDTAYLSDNPTSKAYIVHLNNLRTLTLKENGEVSEDIARTKPPRMEPTVGHAFNLSEEDEQEIEAAPQLEGFKPFENIHETEEHLETLDIPETSAILEEEDNYEISPAPLDISFDDDDDIFAHDEEEAPIEVETPTIDTEDSFSLDSLSLDTQEEEDKSTPSTSETTIEEDDGFDYSYNYDPQVASDELGLPVDLIEEFIQDFIAQAKEFRDELQSSADEGDLENVKVLSHKLKGVAANLRIEDAFNTLSIINTSSDMSEVEKYLHIFYKIIAKLSGEEIVAPQTVATKIEEPEETQESDDDLYHDDLILDFKPEESKESPEVDNDELIIDAPEEIEEEDEENDDDDLYHDFDISIKDSEVPEKIEMPELADDDFLNEETQEIDTIDDLLSIDEEEELDNEELAIEDEISIDIEEVNTSSSSEEEESTDLDELEEFNIEEDIQEPIEINYSKEIIANEIGLDQESFNEIFDDYILDSKSSIAAIHKAISEDDFTKCKKEGVKLKGMSENMRVNTFKEELTSLINSSDKDELSKAVKKIDAAIAQISK